MRTRKVSFTDSQDAYIAGLVADGSYPNVNAVTRDSVRERYARHEARLKRLRQLRINSDAEGTKGTGDC